MIGKSDESGLGVRPARSLAARGTALVCLAIAATAILQWRGGRQSRIVLTPAIAAYQIDPNIATRDELMLLPGIGPAVAAQIMDYRASVENFPAFRTAEDLDAVHRIGPGIVDRVRPFLKFPQSPLPPLAERRGE